MAKCWTCLFLGMCRYFCKILTQCAKIHQDFPHFVARTESFDGKIAHCGIIRFSPLKLLHHKFPKKLQLAKIFEHAKSPQLLAKNTPVCCIFVLALIFQKFIATELENVILETELKFLPSNRLACTDILLEMIRVIARLLKSV